MVEAHKPTPIHTQSESENESRNISSLVLTLIKSFIMRQVDVAFFTDKGLIV